MDWQRVLQALAQKSVEQVDAKTLDALDESAKLTFEAIEHINRRFTDSELAVFSHLLPAEIGSYFEPTDLDQAIAHLLDGGILPSINANPRMSMKYDVELRETAKVKRTASNFQRHLAAHSECWQQKTLFGIVPKKLLAKISEDEFNIYENAVYARLLDHLLRYIDGAVKRLRQLVDVAEQVEKLNGKGRDHRFLRQVTSDWGRAFNDNRLLAQQSKHSLGKLERYKGLVIQLIHGQLYALVPRKRQVPLTLKPTNILMHDEYYRFVADTWRKWVAFSAGFRLSEVQKKERDEQRLEEYSRYCYKVILQVFENMNWLSLRTEGGYILKAANEIDLKLCTHQQGLWQIRHLDEVICSIAVLPLFASHVTLAGCPANFIVLAAQTLGKNLPVSVIELTPLKLESKETFSHMILKCLWSYILRVYTQPMAKKMPNKVRDTLADNQQIFRPLNQTQLDQLDLVAAKPLSKNIRLKHSIADFVRCCPCCGRTANDKNIVYSDNGYFKGKCISRDCQSTWCFEPNHSNRFTLNDGSDTAGRFAFSIEFES